MCLLHVLLVFASACWSELLTLPSITICNPPPRTHLAFDAMAASSSHHDRATDPNGAQAPSAMPPEHGPHENSWYTVLGVARDADIAVIRRAHRRVCIANHPDKVQGLANMEDRMRCEEVLKRANSALAILRDPVLRALYDEFLRGGPNMHDAVAAQRDAVARFENERRQREERLAAEEQAYRRRLAEEEIRRAEAAETARRDAERQRQREAQMEETRLREAERHA